MNFSDPFGLCKEDDPVCRALVAQLRSLSRRAGDIWARTASTYDGYEGGYVEFVPRDDRRITHDPATGYKRMLPPDGIVLGEKYGEDAGNVLIVSDFHPGDQLVIIVHEGGHLDGFQHSPRLQGIYDPREFQRREAAACSSMPSELRAGATEKC